jgi:hypothetical protein
MMTDSSLGSFGGTKFGELQKESSKIALELNHGMIVEALKEYMFTSAP